MYQIKNVCEHCENRKPGCHSSCPAYISAKEELEHRKRMGKSYIAAADYIMSQKGRKK